jgi:hypothetical protein
MARDFCRNFIDIVGNEEIRTIVTLGNVLLSNYAFDRWHAVSDLFFGIRPGAQYQCEDLTGSEFIEYAYGEWGDFDQWCFKSATRTPDRFEDHIVKILATVDPNVYLRNLYDSELGTFIGVRYKAIKGNRLVSVLRHQPIYEQVVFEGYKKFDDQITWAELWDRQADLDLDARKEFELVMGMQRTA